MAKKYSIVVPYVFGLYYVLNFFSANPSIISVETFTKAVFAFGAIIFVFHITAWFILRDKTKASFGTLIFLILFFSYSLFEENTIILMSPLIPANMAKTVLGTVSLALLIYFFCLIKKTNSEFKDVSSFISIFLLALIIMPSCTLLKYSKETRAVSTSEAIQKCPEDLDINDHLPDIYHIVLDGYGREDVLRDYYNLNNSDFIAFLRENGFTVRDDCHTNYIWTECSVASMLSMNYLQESDLDVNISHQLLNNMNKKAGAGKILSDYGYEYVEVASPVPTRQSADFMNMYKETADIYKYLLYQTPFKYIYAHNFIKNDSEVYDSWRDRLLGYFNALESVPVQNSGPTYTYCHFLLPHPPFVFDSQGKPVNPDRPFSINDCSEFIRTGGTTEEYRKGYIQQIIYTNLRLKQTVDKILETSKRPAVFIISSDHGPRLLIDQYSKEKSQFQEALPIFLAYKLPEDDAPDLSQVTSPVNIYRVILNHYFGTNYALLPDRFYYSPRYNPLYFEDASTLINTVGNK